ncbi:MAG: ParB N-terminal domain-containing protein [Methyloceanibacter sp.]|nr:ParB N-terminal domain-containing protein [Methyloceanibacter sp.]
MAKVTDGLEIHYADPRALKPAERNPRYMPEGEMEALKRSLETWGMVDPIIIRQEDGRVIGGHQRLEAAIDIGMARVPVVEIDVSKLDAKLINQALNRIHGRWHEAELMLIQDEIRLEGGDLSLTGFTENELRLGKDSARTNDNFAALRAKSGGYVGLQFGEILVAMPTSTYEALLAYIREHYPEDDRAGVVFIINAGLATVGVEVETEPEPAPES